MRKFQSIALLAVFCCTAARAQTLADRVPAEAIAYLGWKGADSPDNGYAGSHLQAVIDASGFAQIRDQVVPQLMQKLTEQSSDHGENAMVARTMLEIFWRHPTAAFFAGVSKTAAGEPSPKFGVICQAGRDGDALMTIFNAGAHSPGAAQKSRAFVSGDCTVFLTGYDSDAIPAAGDSASSLQSNDAFAKTIEQTGKDPFICAYLDVAGALTQIDDAIASSGNDNAINAWPNARDASGLAGVKHVCISAGFEGRDWRSETFFDAPSPRSGLLTVLEPAPLDPDLLARIPATAASATVGQFSLGLLLQQSRAIAVAANPAAGDIFDKGMGLVQMMVGRSLQRDIFDPLGAQWASYADSSIPAPTITALQTTPPADPNPTSTTQPAMAGLNVVLVNKLIDPAKALQGWTMLSYALSNASAGYIQNHRLPISTAMTKNGDQSIFTVITPMAQPSWTIKDGFMYFGFSPDGVTAAADRPAGPAITQQPAFAALAKQLDPTSTYSGFVYANLPATAQAAYPASEAAINQLRALAQQQSITLPEHILPPLDRLLPELTPALSVSWADAAGWHSRSREPFPGSSPQADLIGVGGAALGASILLPSLSRARETANRVKCASNERQIGQGILLFSNDHRGKYPASLADLLIGGYVDPQVFLCPSSNSSLPANFKTMAPADLGAWVADHGDYVYVGSGMNNTAAADAIVVYEKPEDHHAGMNMLYGDGHVEFNVMGNAVRMIQDQHKTVPTVKLSDVPQQ